MSRLIILVEGQTEETFVNDILSEYLGHRGFHSVTAKLIGNARLRATRGGIKSWQSAKQDIIRHLTTDDEQIVSTLVDFYGLPADGAKAWPGRDTALHGNALDKGEHVQAALSEAIGLEMGLGFDPDRFVPFVLMHEFEALLFSDVHSFCQAIGKPEQVDAMRAIRDEFTTPEEINDSPITAPSKRILQVFPAYEKPLMGALGILEIGLPSIRNCCAHFNRWLTTLESRVNR